MTQNIIITFIDLYQLFLSQFNHQSVEYVLADIMKLTVVLCGLVVLFSSVNGQGMFSKECSIFCSSRSMDKRRVMKLGISHFCLFK